MDKYDDFGMRITPAARKAMIEGDIDNMITAMIPGGIERQEAQGQADLCQSERLPKDLGGWNKGDVREEYAKHGIRVIDDADDIFFNVQLPEGWKLVPTDHSMHNDLLDEQGRRRAGIFYKAAFYDRSAHINFTTRFGVAVVPTDRYKDGKLSYEDRKKLPTVGIVTDGGEEIFECEGYIEADCVNEDGSFNWDLDDRLKKATFEFAEKWLVETQGYPDYKNETAYWNEE